MLKYRKILGLPVFVEGNAKRLGVVKDVEFIDERNVSSVIILSDGMHKHYCHTDFDTITHFGVDAVILKRDATIGKSSSGITKRNKKNNEIRHQAGHILFNFVITNGGENVGSVQDLLFDEISGKVEALEVSKGLLSDLFEGRVIVPLLGNYYADDEYVMISKDSYEEIIRGKKGLFSTNTSLSKEEVRE